MNHVNPKYVCSMSLSPQSGYRTLSAPYALGSLMTLSIKGTHPTYTLLPAVTIMVVLSWGRLLLCKGHLTMSQFRGTPDIQWVEATEWSASHSAQDPHVVSSAVTESPCPGLFGV